MPEPVCDHVGVRIDRRAPAVDARRVDDERQSAPPRFLAQRKQRLGTWHGPVEDAEA